LYEEERDRSMVDMLNVLYVAMTRARNRMFIFSQSPPKSVEDAASLPKMFYHFLVHEGLWNEDRKAYTWGLEEPALRGEKATQPEAGETLRTGFPDWTRRVRLRTTAPEGWDVEDPEKAVSAGKKVHYILSEIRYAEDCEAAIHNGMAQGIISPDEFDHVHAMVLSLVNGPSTAFLFDHSWTVKNEAEIVDSRGKILRPDRLMFHDSEAVVVDFKTGMPSEHHFTQVNGYAALLRELGYTVNDAWIVYLGAEARLVQATGS